MLSSTEGRGGSRSRLLTESGTGTTPKPSGRAGSVGDDAEKRGSPSIDDVWCGCGTLSDTGAHARAPIWILRGRVGSPAPSSFMPPFCGNPRFTYAKSTKTPRHCNKRLRGAWSLTKRPFRPLTIPDSGTAPATQRTGTRDRAGHKRPPHPEKKYAACHTSGICDHTERTAPRPYVPHKQPSKAPQAPSPCHLPSDAPFPSE
jgi:hypothetical protein